MGGFVTYKTVKVVYNYAESVKLNSLSQSKRNERNQILREVRKNHIKNASLSPEAEGLILNLSLSELQHSLIYQSLEN